MDWDQPRPPVSLLLMTQIAVDHGASAEQCLAGTGLTPQQLLDPAVEVTPRHDLAVARNLLDLVPTGQPGLEMGSRFQLSEQGIYGFALLSSSTLRQAIDIGVTFVELAFAMGSVHSRTSDNGDLLLVLEASDIPPSMRRFYIERDAASIRTIARGLSPKLDVIKRVQFAFPPPDEGVTHYAETFGDTPTFDAPESVLVIDGAQLDQPLPGANPHTAAHAIEQCRRLLESRRARTGVAGQVRNRLLAEIANPPALDAVADTLHMSGRTLRKRLAAERTSYRQLLDEVREHLAEELLVSARLPVEQIAHRLGYLEATSFSQAFRRWKGVGPREFRAGSTSRQ
ncbi:transcriptional regulator [Nocardia neocaledoniensis NBRC 108232]|uniref:AraC family transcriptional regulator n=1 Tax=Nocardia neocaledoniensis TaxID=236511 RepID=A0A317NBN4_9NOCA|nr:AraC family transcriptional regulator [Nocardia neocaledoniensis]PWV71028.1 AraC family transcriptional regulator [Nocardia neocaledoniensis]GEM30308.1 transcriptional regulator [Nocardia neocaledoniensis NBRC 108232]